MYQIDEAFEKAFLAGKADDLFLYFGSRLIKDEDNKILYTLFRIYAPNAIEVRLIGSFNNFNGQLHVLKKVSHIGIYEIKINENLEWASYKYEIITKDHQVLHKSDPFGFFSEVRPNTASRVYDIDNYHWHDNDYLYFKEKPYLKPLLIYEVHLGSWKRDENNNFISYSQIVNDLISYVKEHNFTHVELMPIYEHPLDDSWGYQGVGYFAATSRFGSPKDLMYFIDRMHQENIGVICDWVLGHICTDAHGLSFLDGSYLYEFDDPSKRKNEVWGTNNLDFSKGITRSFMLSALTFWVKYFHVDGFRIDAVANLIYYFGDKSKGQNTSAISFLKELGLHLFKLDDRLLFIAEDSTDYPMVTHPIDLGGVGFNYKWNMGFMNDTLAYFKQDPINRKHHHQKITFGMMYNYNENFILPYSHDEVVHMKGSLISRMPGSYEEKFANYKLLMTLFMTYPGKKLLFMGSEFAQFSEWDFNKGLDFHLLSYESHQKANHYFKDLTKLYRDHEAFYALDHHVEGFKWLVVDDYLQSVFVYLRESQKETFVIILNMTPNIHEGYQINVVNKGKYKIVLNSDKLQYFGNNHFLNKVYMTKGRKNNYYLKVNIGPLSALILQYERCQGDD